MPVQTVTGPISPAELGPTLMHEHVLVDFTPPYRRGEEDAEITLETVWELNYNWVEAPGVRRLVDPKVALREMNRLKADGGLSLVEASIPGMVTNPEGLRALSEESGVNIIMGCGRYLEEFMSESDKLRTVDDLAREFVSCVRDGFDGTAVKAGLIGEIGCSWPWTDAERRSVTAAGLAQQETGALVSIHPGRAPEAPFAIAEALQAAGADLQRTIMCHVERRLYDSESIIRLAETGMVLEFDLFGLESSYSAQGRGVPLSSDGGRLDWIEALLQAGYRDQIVISHDICQKTRLVEFGGHGYGHIFRNIIPMMQRRGIDNVDIESILVLNPARLLDFGDST